MARQFFNMRRAAAGAAAAVLSLGTLAACGSSESDGGGSGADSGDSGGVSGATLKIMAMGPLTSAAGVQTPPQSELAVGAKAAVEEINDAGGIDGTKLELVTCDSGGTKNGGVTCANKAVSEDVAAVVGAVDFYGDYISVLKAAKIPNVGPLPIQAELADDNSWPVEGGASVVPAGAVTFAAENGGSSLAYVGNESAYTSSIPTIVKPVLDAHSGFDLNMVSIPATATDLSAYVAKALDSDFVDLATFNPSHTQAFIQAYVDAGGDPAHLLTSASTLNDTVLKQLGDSADGVLVTSLFVPATDPTSKAAKAFVAAMDAVDSDALKNEVSQNAYVAVQLLLEALKGHPAASAADVTNALTGATNLDLGLIPPISFDAPADGAPAPRIFNDAIVLATVEGGKIVASDEGAFSAYTGTKLD